jgi:hypothetical protein
MQPPPDDPWRVSWDAIDARAWAYLNRNGQIPESVRKGLPFHGCPRLRLWSDPGGVGCEVEPTTLTVFELFTEIHERSPVVREAVWQRTADLNRVRGAIEQSMAAVMLLPTVGERYAPVPREQLSRFLREACPFQVPVTWPNARESVTSGGGSVGFEFFSRDQPPASLRLEWSFETPAAWQPFIDWYERLRQFLESCLPGTEQQGEPSAALDWGTMTTPDS